VHFSDDVDFEINFLTLLGPSGEMHSPYVAGSTFRIYLETPTRTDKSGWTLESSAPGVLKVGAPQVSNLGETFRVEAAAGAEGEAVLTARDVGGTIVGETRVEVLRPDRVELLAHGPLLLHRPEQPAPEARILAGGTATYLARYFRDGRRLSGNGVLTAEPTSSVGVNVLRSYLFEDRDWLQLSPRSIGRFTVDLTVDGQRVGSVPVEAVGEGDIANIVLSGEDERGASKDESLVVVAEAYDREGRPIYGVEYDWDLDGVRERGEGDLYRYRFDRDEPHRLGAHHGGHSAQVMIHGEGYVSSTNFVGCSAGGAPGAAAIPCLLLLAGAALLLRRRRLSP
jgi:uncharacterized protein (TIGR03382 family)